MINQLTMQNLATLSGSWRQTIPYRGCVAHWPMNEGSGPLVYDISGIARANCTMGGAPTYQVDRRSYVINFGGADWLDTGVEQVDEIRLFADGVRRFTVSYWAKCAAANSGTIIGRASATTGNRTFQTYFGGGTNTPALVIRGSTTGTNAGLQDDQWHHHAVRYDGSVMQFFGDGRLVINVTVGTAAEDVGQRIIIGARTNGTAFRLTGQVSDVRIFNRRLSRGEIGRLYTDDLQVYRLALHNANRSFYAPAPAAPAGLPPNSQALLGVGI